MNETVKEHSLLTLHYRLATADDTWKSGGESGRVLTQ